MMSETPQSIEKDHDGCDCTELCSMGPTCPGGALAGLPGSGCHRVNPPSSGLLAALERAVETVFDTPCACGCGRRLPHESDPNVAVYATPACYGRSLRYPPD